jgi:myo-inositol 2-dehydrogenase/D-chiro-inositol 1-dehydrogenase
MLNVGLLGAGRIAGVHATAISSHEGSSLLAVSDYFPENAEKLAATYKCSARSTEDIIADPNIDAVLIASSTDTHSDLIEAATAAGKSVLCEKPVDLSLERARACQNAISAHGKPVMIGFNRRFDPNFKRARDLVVEGRIGTPEIVRITSRDPEPPPIDYVKVSGGLFLDMAIHDFDMCRFLLNEEVKRIFASGICLVDPAIGQAGDVDTAVTTLTYQSNALCTIDNSRRSVSGYDQRVEIFGSKGCVMVDNPSRNTAVYYSDQQVGKDLPHFFFLDRYQEAYVNEAKDFIQCILEDRSPSVGGLDGKISVLMGLDALKSYRENRPVDVSYI